MDEKSKRTFIIVTSIFLAIMVIFAFFLITASNRKKKRPGIEVPSVQLGEISKAETTVDKTTEKEQPKSVNEEEKSERSDIVETTENNREKVESVSEEDVPNTIIENNPYLLDYQALDINSVPQYVKEPFVAINNNIPTFSEADKDNKTFEYYSEQDELGRCRVATANLSKELMPTEERGPMGHIRPTGWHTVKYPEQIGDVYLYNRCHLIAYSLAGENDNVKNLITGTRFMNVSGMLPLEREVANYLETTGNHVLYRVNPIFVGDELVARGVQMEAFSVEDNGQGICFNVFVYNVQPGIGIDYQTGNSWVAE